MPQRIDVPGVGVVEFPDSMSDDQITGAIKSMSPPKIGLAEDVAKSAGVGVAKGGIQLLGLGGDIGSAVSSGVDWAAGKLGLDQDHYKRAKALVANGMRFNPATSLF